MEGFFQRAKSMAEEAAKRTQELAQQTAKYSQELAKETAKVSNQLANETARYSEQLANNPTIQDLASRSRSFAQEAAKKTQELAKEAAVKIPALAQQTAKSAEEGLQTLVKELKVGNVSQKQSLEEELEEYGVTEDLREFVRGMTLDTFKDFPPDEEIKSLKDEAAIEDGLAPLAAASASAAGSDGKGGEREVGRDNVRHDLNPFQARHAILVLQCVKEISSFRYQLCPRIMSEQRFWQVYFQLVHSHITPFEKKAADRQRMKLAAAAGSVASEEAAVRTTNPPVAGTAGALASSSAIASAAGAAAGAAGLAVVGSAEEDDSAADVDAPQLSGDDIDALLMDALGTDDAGDEDDDDGAFDTEDFDELVKSAVGSDLDDLTK